MRRQSRHTGLFRLVHLAFPLVFLGGATFPHIAKAESTLGQRGTVRDESAVSRAHHPASRSTTRARRDDRLGAAFAMAFGGSVKASRTGDVLELTFDPKLPRPRAFPRENTRLFRALLRATSSLLGGDEGDDYLVGSYFGEPPPEPRYLEAKQRIPGSDIAFEAPLVQAWFDDAGYLVRVRVVGEAVRGTAEVHRLPKIDEGRATACAVRAAGVTATEATTRLGLALRDGKAYLAYRVRVTARTATRATAKVEADVDATTCAVTVNEGEH